MRLSRLHGFCLRIFECPECGMRLTAPKRRSRMTPNGHLKSLYCPRCKTERKFIQVSVEVL